MELVGGSSCGCFSSFWVQGSVGIHILFALLGILYLVLSVEFVQYCCQRFCVCKNVVLWSFDCVSTTNGPLGLAFQYENKNVH